MQIRQLFAGERENFKYFEDSWTQGQIPFIYKDMENHNGTLFQLDTCYWTRLRPFTWHKANPKYWHQVVVGEKKKKKIQCLLKDIKQGNERQASYPFKLCLWVSFFFFFFWLNGKSKEALFVPSSYNFYVIFFNHNFGS